MSGTALLTIVAGRHDHLRGQLLGLRASTSAPRWHVVAAMGDPGVRAVVDAVQREFPGPAATETLVLDVPVAAPGDPAGAPAGELPLARARNAAAAAALRRGADLLVLLDVDCVPSPGLLAAYEAAARDPRVLGAPAPALLCGAVAYLPPRPPLRTPADLAGLAGAADPHPARPAPPPGEVVRAAEEQWWLFWSLSFAVRAADWQRLGGFCEDYRGYGGEDTDVAATARALGGSLHWVGGADAAHQHHPTRNPPVQHLHAVLRNAAVFHRRWGWFPMQGWLTEFARLGLARYDAATSTWSAAPSAASERR